MSGVTDGRAGRRGPLAGIRVLDYGQYVAAPFGTMLLADLGADVIKVEPPTGDQWRHYEPFAPGESRYFYALNRNKRSVALDLRTSEGRARSQELIRTADALVQNCLPERAKRFALDRESVREINPRCVWVSISAFGSEGPDAQRPAYDLIAQALSGLLMADTRPDDPVPRRMGGLAVADFTCGLLAAIAVLAGLAARKDGSSHGIEVSLLGAALAVQAQRFVSVESNDRPARAERLEEGPPFATPEDLASLAGRIARLDELEPYYRTYRCADGFLALACLNTRHRLEVCATLGLDDPWAANPQAAPEDEAERQKRLGHARGIEDAFAERPVAQWVELLGARGVPASEVRFLDLLYEDGQVEANGLVQTVTQPAVGDVRLLGNVFKVDGQAAGATRGAPGLGEHARELLETEARGAAS
ncbi:MAG: CoA transferase [Actinomycetota bacterium]|nr:CoA transferase [Actinomycetota bacterium]